MYIKISGKVIEGKKLGRNMGFPTANILLSYHHIPDGTYKINVVVDGKTHKGVGAYLTNSKVFEAHIFDFNGDLYGKEIDVYILNKIRKNKKFESIALLRKQILEDVDFCKKHTDTVITFGTFDIFHEGHKHFLRQAKLWGDMLVCIVATDENVIKFKNQPPLNSESYRLNTLIESKIADICIIGKGDNPMQWMDAYRPKIVCLGYDQQGFSNELKDYIHKHSLNTHILRLEPYKETEFKSSILRSKQPY